MERHTDLEDFGMGHLDDKVSWIYGNAMLTATTATTATSSWSDMA